MSKKALELEARNIMQGLEEFATFMSYNSNVEGMRILSVEAIELDSHHSPQQQKAEVIAMPINRISSRDSNEQQLRKSLCF